ncbi:hypothetical protein HIM_03020 [Hirsutella minnesotensis 3608]|nr:hypothetical protein HIM_03020 [Hirsutella minnesotensis 3608]
MSFTAGFHMPGGFQTEGVHHGLFRPPASPASSSGYLTSRSLPPGIDAATPKRKRRPGLDAVTRRPSLRLALDQDNDLAMLGAPVTMAQQERAYALAGQLDIPSSGIDDGANLDESMYSDSNYRRALGSKRSRQDSDPIDDGAPTALFSLPDKPAVPRSWSSFAFYTIGDVVGRVWDFCTAGAFRGFYAGGGQGYAIDGADLHPSSILRSFDDYGNEWRVPGQYPECNYSFAGGALDADAIAPEEQTSSAVETRSPTPTRPAAKRRQTAQADDLGRNWVMVKEPRGSQKSSSRPWQTCPRATPRNRPPCLPPTPGRRINTPVTRKPAEPNTRRQANRLGHMALPESEQPPRPASSASYASPRTPSPNKSVRNRAAFASTASIASPSCVASGHSRRRSLLPSPVHPTASHRRSHSNASTASSRAGASDVDASPRLNAEAKKLAARRQMEDRDADVRIEAFNKRLQDMIRQGKEALGTRIEIDGGDGGWEDDD